MSRFAILGLVGLACTPEPVEDTVRLGKLEAGELTHKVVTMCVPQATLDVEPRMFDFVDGALTYWRKRGEHVVYELIEGDVCDIPVVFTEEWDWVELSERSAAAAGYRGELEPGKCVGVQLHVRLSRWGSLIDNEYEAVAITHEVGHLLCKPHNFEDDTDIMAPDGGL